MKNEEITKYMEYLLDIALHKCGNSYDAEDLVQETVLAALTYLEKGKQIDSPRKWLAVVMNRKYYDQLRCKYNRPTVTIADDFDVADTEDFVSDYIRREEGEQVRREITYLTESYRNIIVRHYFYQESVESIARALSLPIGTVKSRLDFGRKQMKKGFEKMEKYTENSYAPKRMSISIGGSSGMNGEPWSLVKHNDLLTQNILIVAYEKPLTVTELSRALGTPAAYVEPIVDRLVEGELMKRMGDGKVYTDFIIYSFDDLWKYKTDAKTFAAEYADAYCLPMKKAIEALKETEFYSIRLERYMLLDIAQQASIAARNRLITPYPVPDRPNGGKWEAFGQIYGDRDEIPEDARGRDYLLSGKRECSLNKYFDTKDLCICDFESSLYPYAAYDKYLVSSSEDLEETIQNSIKLFYLIEKGIDPESIGFDEKMLSKLPQLEKRGFLTSENKKWRLLIPHLTHAQHTVLTQIVRKAAVEIADALEAPLGEYFKTHRKLLPAHLKSVPEYRLFWRYQPQETMFVYEAINHGIHPYDLGFICPETIIVFD